MRQTTGPCGDVPSRLFQQPATPRIRPTGPAATVTATPGGLPTLLSETLFEIPLMPERVTRVTTTSTLRADAPYTLQFSCSVPDNKEQLSGAELNLREQELVLIPTFERVPGDLLTRSPESLVQIEIPPAPSNPAGTKHCS